MNEYLLEIFEAIIAANFPEWRIVYGYEGLMNLQADNHNEDVFWLDEQMTVTPLNSPNITVLDLWKFNFSITRVNTTLNSDSKTTTYETQKEFRGNINTISQKLYESDSVYRRSGQNTIQYTLLPLKGVYDANRDGWFVSMNFIINPKLGIC